MQIISAILGAALLLFGRKLYWLAVGILGFLAGVVLAEDLLADKQLMLQVFVAILAGVVGAVLAVVFQRVAFALAGFFAGGFLALAVAASFELSSNASLLSLACGGIVGAILAALVMDRAIIALTALAGAAAIVLALELAPLFSALLFVTMAVVGMAFQSRTMEPRDNV